MYSLANAYSLSIPAEIISDTNFVFIFFIQNVDRVINWGKCVSNYMVYVGKN